MKKKLMIVLIMMFGLVLFGGVDCFAGGAWEGTGDIGGDIGGGGGGGGSDKCYNENGKLTNAGTYLLSCQGFSWAYYKATDAAKGKDVEFRPWGQVIIPSTCSEHDGKPGGFWHFGRNAVGLKTSYYYNNDPKGAEVGYFGGYNFVHFLYNIDPWYFTYYEDYIFEDGTLVPSHSKYWPKDFDGERRRLYTYSTESGSRGHYETYKYGSYKNNYSNMEKCNGGCYKKDNLANHKLYYDGEVVYEIDKDKSMAELDKVLKDYKVAHKYFDPTGPEPTDFPDELYAFCYWEGMDTEYYGASSVTMSPKPEGSESNWLGTGWRTESDSNDSRNKNFGPVTVSVGDTVKIKFSHDISATALSNNVGWSVTREWYGNDQSDKTMSGTVNLTKQSNERYVIESGDNVFSEEFDIKFDKAGEYTYCESLTIDKLQTKPITRMCAKVNVRPIEYYGESNVAVSPKPEGEEYKWKGTEITSTQKDVTYGPSVIGVGGTATITFSHKVFANKEANGVAWRVDRNWDKSSGYTYISSASSSGTANLTIKENNYYTQGSTDYYDGTHYYTMRDVYNITFDTIGTYTFCESLTINDAGEYITKACAVVKVEPVEYYTSSNVAVGKTHFRSTGVTKSPDIATDDLIYVKVKDQVPVTFSHMIYSYNKSGDVQWLVNRKFNICSNNDNNEKCTLTPRENKTDPLNNGNSGFDSVVINKSKLNEESDVTIDGHRLWYSPQNVEYGYVGRPYADGGDARYSWRDIYWAVFKKVGDYSGDGNNLCERLSIPGSGNEMTGACSNVKAPYNFKNSASIQLGEGIVQVGGTVEIKSATVTVGKKTNGKVWCGNRVDTGDGTGYCPDEYATQVDNATIKLIEYSASSMGGSAKEGHGNKDSNLCDQSVIGGSSTWCNTEDETGVYLNQENNTEGATTSAGINSTERAIATDAGGYYCVRLAIYPYTNGVDDNVNNPEGSNSWYISAPSCVQVGKKPTFQVWGGSVYSAGVINAYSFIRSTNDGKKTFGSWVEQSAVANGSISEFASGAATSQGASTDFCKYQVPLTFANYPCEGALAGNANIAANVAGKSAAINYWWVANPVINGSDFKYDVNANGDGMYYKYSAGDTEIGGMTIGRGKTYVLRSRDGNIYIRDNILYENGPYKLASDIPKLIMYAKNIYIGCNVKRVDAILVADNKIDTCAGADGENPDLNGSQRSNQLTINGVLMAKVVRFNRTYGGGAGEEAAKTPAEIVNYDTSTMLWGRGGTESGADSLFTVVYQQELAPRY